MDAPDAGASPLQHLQHGEFQRELAHAISELPERERLVLSMYYERELNLRGIGAVLKVSERRGCQIQGQALLRMRARHKYWPAAVDYLVAVTASRLEERACGKEGGSKGHT